MIKVRKSLVWLTAAFLILVGLFAAFIIPDRLRVLGQSEPRDFGSEMVKKTEQGRFDEAIQVGLQALQNQPSDEFVYEQIADVYLIRARKDPDQKEQWVAKAVFYTDKALSQNSRVAD